MSRFWHAKLRWGKGEEEEEEEDAVSNLYSSVASAL
jgi:hypothetical protein